MRTELGTLTTNLSTLLILLLNNRPKPKVTMMAGAYRLQTELGISYYRIDHTMEFTTSRGYMQTEMGILYYKIEHAMDLQ